MIIKDETRLKVRITLDNYYSIGIPPLGSKEQQEKTVKDKLKELFNEKMPIILREYNWDLKEIHDVNVVEYRIGYPPAGFGGSSWIEVKKFEVDFTLTPGENAVPIKIEKGKWESGIKSAGVVAGVVALTILIGAVIALIWSVKFAVIDPIFKPALEEPEKAKKAIDVVITPLKWIGYIILGIFLLLMAIRFGWFDKLFNKEGSK